MSLECHALEGGQLLRLLIKKLIETDDVRYFRSQEAKLPTQIRSIHTPDSPHRTLADNRTVRLGDESPFGLKIAVPAPTDVFAFRRNLSAS